MSRTPTTSLLLLFALAGCPKSEPAPSPTLQVDTLAVGDAACPAGGVRLLGPGDERRAICNGTSAMAATLTITALPVGDATCPAGGARLEAGGTVSSICAGAAGTEGAVGPAGAPGESVSMTTLPVGDTACPSGGSRFTVGGVSTVACNGREGAPGPAGAAVVVTPLSPGDAQCPFGGAQFTVGTSVGRACNGSLPPGALGQGALVLTQGAAAPLTFSRGALGVETEVVEQRLIGPNGDEITRLLPGRSRVREVTLVGTLGADDSLWRWRDQALANVMAARRTARLQVRAGATALLDVDLVNAWPTAIRQRATAGRREFEVTLVAEGLLVNTAGSATSAFQALATVEDPARFSSPGVALSAVEGPESSHEVTSANLPDGGVGFVPGRLTTARLTFTRPVRGDLALLQWYQAMRANVSAARSSTLVLRSPAPAEWTFVNALPFAWSVALSDDGLPTESLFVAAEAMSRVQ